MVKKHTPRATGAVDVQLGNRIRQRRMQAGMSQDILGQTIGVTFQQIQKYEKGTNRVTVSKLLMIAEALDESPAYFIPSKKPSEDALSFERLITSISGMNLLKAFEKLSTQQRQVLVNMAEALGK